MGLLWLGRSIPEAPLQHRRSLHERGARLLQQPQHGVQQPCQPDRAAPIKRHRPAPDPALQQQLQRGLWSARLGVCGRLGEQRHRLPGQHRPPGPQLREHPRGPGIRWWWNRQPASISTQIPAPPQLLPPHPCDQHRKHQPRPHLERKGPAQTDLWLIRRWSHDLWLPTSGRAGIPCSCGRVGNGQHVHVRWRLHVHQRLFLWHFWGRLRNWRQWGLQRWGLWGRCCGQAACVF